MRDDYTCVDIAAPHAATLPYYNTTTVTGAVLQYYSTASQQVSVRTCSDDDPVHYNINPVLQWKSYVTAIRKEAILYIHRT